jgi:hypothetical protein
MLASIADLDKTRADFARAYGEEGAPSAVVNVPAGRGTLADIIAFAKA